MKSVHDRNNATATREIMDPQADARNAIAQNRSLAHKIADLVLREGITHNHRHDEPLFVPSMVA
jgi:hypothetical protein